MHGAYKLQSICLHYPRRARDENGSAGIGPTYSRWVAVTLTEIRDQIEDRLSAITAQKDALKREEAQLKKALNALRSRPATNGRGQSVMVRQQLVSLMAVISEKPRLSGRQLAGELGLKTSRADYLLQVGRKKQLLRRDGARLVLVEPGATQFSVDVLTPVIVELLGRREAPTADEAFQAIGVRPLREHFDATLTALIADGRVAVLEDQLFLTADSPAAANMADRAP